MTKAIDAYFELENRGHPLSAVSRVDVLIPVYNAETTVVQAVRSILNQTFRDIRVIVVDDGSTDGTGRCLALLAAQDSRLVVHRQPNGGIVDALNNGLALCTANLIARHDADDNALPDRLEKQITYLDTHPDCVAVGGNAFHIDATGRRLGSATVMKNPEWADVNDFPADEPYMMHPLLVIRRRNLMEAGGYRHVFHAEDTDLYWRLLEGGGLHNMTDILAEYRIHPESVSSKSVMNGRVQAVNSQLAAVSHRRRENDLTDLTFPRERLRRFHEAETIQAMMEVGEEELQASELPHFRLAVAAKLLDLVSYRPYQIDDDDRAFINDALVRYGSLAKPERRRSLERHVAKYAIRLALSRQFRAAIRLLRPPVMLALPTVVFHLLKERAYKQRKSHA